MSLGRDFSTTRAAALGARGLVATAHPLATAAGVRVLQDGGNAVDAALTAAAVTWVTLPMMCGPGGDAFLLIHDARTGAVAAIGGSGVVGARATPDYLRAAGDGQLMPLEGLLSAAVPGAVDAFAVALQQFGTRSWAEMLAPAIHYAAEGHPVYRHVAEYFALDQAKLARHPEAARLYLHQGRTPAEGDLLVQAELGASLTRLAAGGAGCFYRGELAAAIARATATAGLFDLSDLAAHRSEVYTPLSLAYRGFTVHQTAPPSQGIIQLQAMQLLSEWDLAGLGWSAAAQHLLVEALKLAVDERNRYLGDPRCVPSPVPHLLSSERTEALSARIDPHRAATMVGGYRQGDTTYLCTVDRDGNCVSLIHSLSLGFGSGYVVPGTGILLNNRAGRGFTLIDGHPNQIAPGKRPMHTLNCYLATRAGRPVLVGGTPGGDGQPQWNLQVLTALLDWNFSPQQAVELPRWTFRPATDPHSLAEPFVLNLESRFPAAAVDGLRERGHPLQVVGPWAGGGAAQVIQLQSERGLYVGGSDPRADGCALGI